MKSFVLSILLLTPCCIPVAAQPPDSVLTLTEAKARLMNYNLGLLANYYEISLSKARVIEARVWNNPYFIFNGDMWNSETNEYFGIRNQLLVQVEQTFSVAGKHTNTVKLAKVGVEMSEMQMQEVVRSLILELCNTYNNVAALQTKERLYRQVMDNYDRLMQATTKQLEVGAISVTESVRLEAEYLTVKTAALNNLADKERAMGSLRTLLRYPMDTTIQVEQQIPPMGQDFDTRYLAEQAVTSRPDVELARLEVKYQERNLKVQRSTAVPDIKFGFQPQDRGSNFIRPYHGFTTELSIPIFNRNQGQIKQAQYSIEQSNLKVQDAENRARNEVAAAYNRYRNSQTGLANYNTQFLSRLSDLNRSANQNFQRRNISLLQFIDQQRIYIETNLQLIDMQQLHLNNVNDLNFSVGTTLIDY